MINSIYNCMSLAEEWGMGVNHMEDIILVTGHHLARSWVRVIFSESRGGAEVSFVAQASRGFRRPYQRAERDWSAVRIWPKRQGGLCIIQTQKKSDTTHTRIYQRTNAYSFEVTTSSVSWTFGQDFVDWQDQLPIYLNLTRIFNSWVSLPMLMWVTPVIFNTYI